MRPLVILLVRSRGGVVAALIPAFVAPTLHSVLG